ncbi:hypothetical protein [Neobacillus vireti]|uniref:hypothetical protein n=1 Tax=Neobacillus vireti TaxID=220686 RepID=UPI002FFF4716
MLEKVTNGILNSKMGKTVRGAEIAMMLGISFTTLLFGGERHFFGRGKSVEAISLEVKSKNKLFRSNKPKLPQLPYFLLHFLFDNIKMYIYYSLIKSA